MKFGVVCAVPGLGDSLSSNGLTELLLRLEQAEELGFESFWMVDGADRHDESGSPLPVAAAYVAMRSQRIALGLLLPLVARFHPLRVAEELAALDTMTDGRIHWSAVEDGGDSPGLFPEAEVRFREQFAIVSRALAGEPFAWQGEAYAFPEVACVPRPVQEPGPPAWVQVESPALVAWAASNGYDVMEDAWSPLAAIEERRALYRECRGASIEDPDLCRFQTSRHVYVGESLAQAREEVGPGLLRAYRERVLHAPTGDPDAEGAQPTPPLDEAAGFHESSESLLDFLFENTVVVGDEVYCRDKVGELRERIGVESLLCCAQWDGLDSRRLFASQKRWIERVVPAFV